MNKNLGDLLKIALKSEIKVNQLYLKLSKVVKEKTMQDFLIKMAEEEKEHELFLKSIIENKHYDLTTPIDSPTIVDLFKAPVDSIRIHENSKLYDIAEIALNRELRAMSIYKLAHDTTNDYKLKALLNQIISEEKGHYQLIRKRMLETIIASKS